MTTPARCPGCAAPPPAWRPDDVECEICATFGMMPGAIDQLEQCLDDGDIDTARTYIAELRDAYRSGATHIATLAIEVTIASQEFSAEDYQLSDNDVIEYNFNTGETLRGGKVIGRIEDMTAEGA